MSTGRITNWPNGRIPPRVPSGTGMTCSKCGGSVEVNQIPLPLPRHVYRCLRCGATKVVEKGADSVTIEMGE